LWLNTNQDPGFLSIEIAGSCSCIKGIIVGEYAETLLVVKTIIHCRSACSGLDTITIITVVDLCDIPIVGCMRNGGGGGGEGSG
jgi:hypothetical protein